MCKYCFACIHLECAYVDRMDLLMNRILDGDSGNLGSFHSKPVAELGDLALVTRELTARWSHIAALC